MAHWNLNIPVGIPSSSMVADIAMFRTSGTNGFKVQNLVVGKKTGQTANTYAVIDYETYLNGAYRYAFNSLSRSLVGSMEYDNEVEGGQNSYTTEFRQYDPRIGRWKSLDPLRFKAANITPYRYAFNSPIMYSDKGGDFERQVIIVELGDGKELYLVRKVNGRFMKGRSRNK